MGNICCPKNEEGEGQKPKKVSNALPNINVEYNLGEVKITIKTSDLMKEEGDAIVFGTDNFVHNRSCPMLSPAIIDSLNKEVEKVRGSA